MSNLSPQCNSAIPKLLNWDSSRTSLFVMCGALCLPPKHPTTTLYVLLVSFGSICNNIDKCIFLGGGGGGGVNRCQTTDNM